MRDELRHKFGDGGPDSIHELRECEAGLMQISSVVSSDALTHRVADDTLLFHHI